MRRFLLFASIAIASTASAQSTFGIALSPTATHDVQCFMLYAAGIGEATDDKTQMAASMGTMYFFGKLKAEAPDIDLEQAIREEAESIARNPNAREIGKACDAEVQNRSDELLSLGQELQESPRQSSPSSS